MTTMTSEEKERLIQRYFDGETLGQERALAERLVEEDPAAAEVLARLRTLSDSIKIDLEAVLAEEDFSEYWNNIAGRLEESSDIPVVAPGVVAAPQQEMVAPRSFFDRLFGSMGLAAAGAAAALILVGVFTKAPESSSSSGMEIAAVMPMSTIDEVESPSQLVMVNQDSQDEPAIVWIVETDISQEG